MKQEAVLEKRVYFILLIIAAIVTGSSIQAAQPIITFHEDSLVISSANYKVRYAGLNNININESFSLPFITLDIKTDNRLTKSDFYTLQEEQLVLAPIPEELNSFRDYITGVNGENTIDPIHNQSNLSSPVLDIQYSYHNGACFTSVTFLPVTISENDELIFNRAIYLESGDATAIIRDFSASLPSPPANPAYRSAITSGVPLGYDYIIITDESLVPVFNELAEYKTSCGYSSTVVTTDSIIQYYSGLDDAAKIRNYLKDFFAAGGRYVLLGGDDVLVPTRYLYYYDTDFPITNAYLLHPSDLYYADLDGDWDSDNDGIWGEPSDDAPDIRPELIVGRLPLRTAEAAQNYIDKLIEYETNPGGGDFNYLARALFFSSDEMRDYPAEGQHGFIAAAMPSQITIDTGMTVETPSGNDPSPTSADGLIGVGKISEGFGFIHILAHGRKDGFIVKSANYGDWPASLILSIPQDNNAHGSLLNLEQNQKTSLYYSLTCDGGAYDLDSTDGESGSWSLVEGLIARPASGAIGMVANSRWGWVYSSYLLQEKFTEYLYGLAGGSPALAMYYSWLEYPSFRDLIYGQNYFGDPTLKVYDGIPARTEIAMDQTGNHTSLYVTVDGEPLPEADVIISSGGEILECGMTDENGEYIIDVTMESNVIYTITAGRSGCTMARESYTPSISLDIDDNDNILPESYALEQNYPNPFNPSTIIGWSLPQKSDVTLEIFNILGQLVESYNFSGQTSGYHSITWHGTDDDNQPVASGVYFYRLRTDDYQETRKMFLIR
ncbi:MAG: hypothetical protein CVT49_04885 [candidate division Zixibacteria bacterium HGW-Zixibacteria-1]|nr:MAG: hypothetical protein CVT49_04885 [candidate division Zixibacteria bacterium HGW-Zixibacteria-1]